MFYGLQVIVYRIFGAVWAGFVGAFDGNDTLFPPLFTFLCFFLVAASKSQSVYCCAYTHSCLSGGASLIGFCQFTYVIAIICPYITIDVSLTVLYLDIIIIDKCAFYHAP